MCKTCDAQKGESREKLSLLSRTSSLSGLLPRIKGMGEKNLVERVVKELVGEWWGGDSPRGIGGDWGGWLGDSY